MKKFFTLVAAAFVAVAANAQNYDMVDLTAESFKNWTAADASAQPTEEAAYGEYVLNASTGQVYGYSTVYYLSFADLSDYDVLVATATEGTPRFLFNRTEDNGAMGYEYPRDAEAGYVTTVDNGDGSITYTLDLAALVSAQGFAHLHAIKGANWASTTVTSLKVGKKIEEPTTGVSAISAAAAQGQCYNILGQRVNNVKAGQIYIINGKKYINR